MTTKINRNEQKPVFKQVAEILGSRINDGKLFPGARIDSEEALVKEFKISRMTARAALKHLEGLGLILSGGRRGRFVNDISNLTTPDNLSPPRKRSLPIALYPFPEQLTGDYFIRIMNGLSRNAVAENVELNYIQASEYQAEGGTLAEFFFKRRIGGIIFKQTNENVIDAMNELARAGLPSVAVNVNLSGSGLSFVCTDNAKATTALLNCLFNMGHRRIGYVSLSRRKRLSAKEKYQTYQNMIDQYQAEFSPEWVFEFPGENWEAELAEIGRLFAGKRKPTALFATTGAPVPYIVRNLATLGIRVPEDVSLVCFDRMKLPQGMPEVTCVEQPVEEMAEIAMNVLLSKIRTGNTEPVEIIIDPVFVPGNSCRFIPNGAHGKEEK
jgi:DNA-binding LacI/PurR family transcriptional regulator/DNA-binding transcriptional regulator YhcF (GntR family)